MVCPFCKVLNEKPNEIIKNNKNTFVILSNPRLMPGHILIIPKRHVERLSDLTMEERNELFDEAIKCEEMVLKKIASGCDISQHYRPFIKQNNLKVNHLHMHIRPRESEDELFEKVQKYETNVFTELKKDEFNKYKKLLSN
ncbi:MAG TPA: HIT family protein [Candidatus Paceibacterota bacterium]|nr:HIT family protein [Candidatus Paceibacterota bacterium]